LLEQDLQETLKAIERLAVAGPSKAHQQIHIAARCCCGHDAQEPNNRRLCTPKRSLTDGRVLA